MPRPSLVDGYSRSQNMEIKRLNAISAALFSGMEMGGSIFISRRDGENEAPMERK